MVFLKTKVQENFNSTCSCYHKALECAACVHMRGPLQRSKYSAFVRFRDLLDDLVHSAILSWGLVEDKMAAGFRRCTP